MLRIGVLRYMGRNQAVRWAVHAVQMLLAGAAPMAIHAQTVPAASPPDSAPGTGEGDADEADTSPSDIVVTGQRQRGAVIGDIAPEEQLGQAEIRSYGVSSIADLLDALSPETASGRGRGGEMPVVLLNGRRISGFAEIRDIPTEAIERVDILPEEVALKYGYRADQKVVNFVLRRRFHAFTAEIDDKIATEGGSNTPQGSVDLLHIRRDDRINLDLNYQRTSPLYEGERDIAQSVGGLPYATAGNVTAATFGDPIDPALSALAGTPVSVAGIPASAVNGTPSLADFAATAGQPNVTDLGRYRTLLAASDELTANLVAHKTLFGGIGATLNGRIDATGSTARQGLPQASLAVPADDPFSPFASPVTVDRYLSDGRPLTQTTSGLASHLGVTLDKDVGQWRLSLIGNYDRTTSHTLTDRGVDVSAAQALIDAGDPGLNPFAPLPAGLVRTLGRDEARSTANTGHVDMLVNGPLLSLPAGPISPSLRVGFETDDFHSSSARAGLASSGSVGRDVENGQLNIDVPIASRRKGFLSALGELSANGNFALDHLSDFGTLKTIGYGLHWRPVSALSLVVSTTDERGAPTPQQLGNPTVLTPNTRVFDYVTGTTVDVTAISGGNADLTADHRHVFKAGLTWKPLTKADLTLRADYTRNRIANSIASFPTPTVAIEAAFPDRFRRDEDGALIEVDDRPVNFAREERSQLRWGFDFSMPLVSKQQKQFAAWRAAHPGGWRGRGERGGDGAQPGSPGAAPARQTPQGSQDTPPPPGDGGPPPGGGGDGPPPGGGGFGGGGGGFGGGGRRGGGFGGPNALGGRLQFAVFHTWYFRDTILIRQGVPELDLLNGAAIGNGGGQPQHQVDVQAGITQNGFGARLSATWQSATSVTGEDAADTLRFHGYTTTSLRLFANIGQQFQLVRKHPWMRGMRVTASIDNLFDQRLHVTDPTGVTPISYQPDYLNPLGRTVRISIRKLFF